MNSLRYLYCGVKEKTKNILRPILSKEVKPHIIDLRGSSNNPFVLLESSKNSSVVVNLPVETGLTFPAFSLTGKKKHAFISALYEAASSHGTSPNEVFSLIEQRLDTFYETFCPANVAQLLGCKSDNEDTSLTKYPAYASVLPWQVPTLDQQKKAIEKSVMQENATFIRHLGVENGWAWCGPVSKEKLRIETTRLLSTYQSIRDKGYIRSNDVDGDIVAIILHKSDKDPLAWHSTIGQHRIMSLSALGYRQIPCRVSKVIKRKDVHIWPNVKSGLFTSESALKIFDAMYNLVHLEE